MSRMKDGKFVIENSDGQIVRTFQWTDGSAALIFREDTRRVELVSQDVLKNDEIPHTLISKVSRSAVMSSPVDLGGFGHLKFVSEVENYEPAIVLEEEDDSQWKKVLKFTSIGHIGTLAVVMLLGLVIIPYFTEEEAQVVQVIQQVRVEKPQTRQKVKTVQVSEKKLKKTVQANSNVTKKKKTQTPIVKNRKKTKGTGSATVAGTGSGRALKVTQVGALGALGGMKNGSKGSAGFNLNSVVNSSGSSLTLEGAGGRGGSPRSLRGKGLVTSAIGSGGEAVGAGGYGTRGKGGGAAGYGSMNIGGSGAGSPGSAGYFQPLEEEALVEGGLDRDQIAAVINRNKGQVIYCYEKGLQVKPELSGRVTVDFTISNTGRVSVARASNSSLNFAQVEGCIVGKLKGWKFPKPVGNVNVNVSYPFVLRRVSQG